MHEPPNEANDRNSQRGAPPDDSAHVDDTRTAPQQDQPAPRTRPRHASSRATYGWARRSGARRPRSVRAKIVTVLLVPVISLMALWGFATVTTAQNVSELRQLKEVNDTLLAPIGEFVSALQAERVAAAEYLVVPEGAQEALDTASRHTDVTAAALRDGVSSSSTDAAGLDPRLPGRIESLVAATDHVAAVRQRVIDSSVSWQVAFNAYTDYIDTAFSVTGVLTQMDAPGVEFDPRVVLELSLAREMIAREDAVMGAAHAAEVMTQPQFTVLTESIRAGQAMLWTDIDDPRPSAEAAYRDILSSQSYQSLRDIEDELADAQAGYTVVADIPEAQWREASTSVQEDLAAGEARVTTIAAQEADLFGFDVLGTSGLAVVLGLVGVVLSLLISVLIGRGLVVELAGLHHTAMDLARRKLPATLRKLNAGQPVDIDTEAPRATHADDEISQVAEALNAVHRSAVRAAIERSDALKGISGVYIYLARRSQVLLHRQLALLDSMERRVDDPDQLEDLFRLDHLTTRMRRQAESLIILSGTAPARGWRNPVPMLDIVRAAIAEIEEFTRVEVAIIPDTRVNGSAVADLIHLIAELIENAVVFSPPHTKATVRGELVGAGLALEIEDRGLGMSDQALIDANHRIRDTDQIDLLEADQLGLFVVNRLSRRHNVEVTLQRSAYGGIKTIVLVPEALLDHRADHPALSDEPAVLDQAAPHPARAELTAVGAAVTPNRPPATTTEASSTPEPVQASTHGFPTRVLAGSPPEGDPADLPRRVRQASMRPELRVATPREEPSNDDVIVRTPEEARATLSALRSGWLRGQSEPEDQGDDR